MSYLDYNHPLYTQAEVDQIYANTQNVINALDKCILNFPYDVYNANIKKRYIKYKFMLDTIKVDLDLTANDEISMDRSKEPYAKDER